jgi:hypothetical protein
MNQRQQLCLESAKQYAISRGGLCLSTTYNRAKDKLLWKCKNNHEWERDYDKTTSRGIWCSICEANEKRQKECDMWYKECLELAKSRDGLCLSLCYIDANTPMEWKCNKDGHVWTTSFSALKNGGSWCARCSKKEPHTLINCNLLAERMGGKCISDQYINNELPLIWECKKNHQWSASYGKINQGHWCLICSGHQVKTLDDAKKVAEEKEGECLSTEYINARTPMLWRCKNGHTWEQTYDNVKRVCWCPECDQAKGEVETRELFEKITGKSFNKKRSIFTNKKMELDGYNDELKIGFEQQGIQHYQYVQFFNRNDTSNFEKQLQRDKLKTNECK